MAKWHTLFYPTEHTVTGYFRKGRHGHYVELEISGLRWDVEADRKQLNLLNKRVCMTGKRVGFKRLRILTIKIAE